jgi:hypothetical protein
LLAPDNTQKPREMNLVKTTPNHSITTDTCSTNKANAIHTNSKTLELLKTTFHTYIREATMEYHRTKDILYVMENLGHKNIKNTLVYVHLAEALFKDQQDYFSKVAQNEKEACELVEAGFEYVCEFNQNKIFRKSKY